MGGSATQTTFCEKRSVLHKKDWKAIQTNSSTTKRQVFSWCEELPSHFDQEKNEKILASLMSSLIFLIIIIIIVHKRWWVVKTFFFFFLEVSSQPLLEAEYWDNCTAQWWQKTCLSRLAVCWYSSAALSRWAVFISVKPFSPSQDAMWWQFHSEKGVVGNRFSLSDLLPAHMPGRWPDGKGVLMCRVRAAQLCGGQKISWDFYPQTDHKDDGP